MVHIAVNEIIMCLVERFPCLPICIPNNAPPCLSWCVLFSDGSLHILRGLGKSALCRRIYRDRISYLLLRCKVASTSCDWPFSSRVQRISAQEMFIDQMRLSK